MTLKPGRVEGQTEWRMETIPGGAQWVNSKKQIYIGRHTKIAAKTNEDIGLMQAEHSF